MTAALVVFVATFLFTAWIYFGYPLLLLMMARLRPRPIASDDTHVPPVSVVVAMHDEEAFVRQKIENTLALDYPRDRLELVIASDGSTDGTHAVARSYAPHGVRLLELERRGKAAALNDGVAAAAGEIVVFTDANNFLAPDAVRKIVRSFADPEVGGVCGNKKYRPLAEADATEEGENLYWRWDKWQKELESRIGSIFAADGTLYAVRKELYVPIADPAQADDIAISTRIVVQGRRLVFDREAVAYEDPPVEGGAEFRRKVRVTNHSVRALLNLGSALWTRGFWSLELLSHKLFRHFVPFALVPMFLANGVLAFGSLVFAALFAAHSLFYVLAIAGAVLRDTSAGNSKILAIPYYFSLVNAAALLGIVSIWTGRRLAVWTPRSGASEEVKQ
jgi:cellulose synthase/poly-beta-1,6-N-acetylglucosamine synthase-like glycosyltransferase